MTKKEYCTTHPPVAYIYDGLYGKHIHGIENGIINDYIYVSEGSRYHKCKIYDCKDIYFKLNGCKVKLSSCIKTNIGW
jgi:hypothetical protein